MGSLSDSMSNHGVQGRAITKDPILDKDTELVPVMHAQGTSGSAKRICCIGK